MYIYIINHVYIHLYIELGNKSKTSLEKHCKFKCQISIQSKTKFFKKRFWASYILDHARTL